MNELEKLGDDLGQAIFRIECYIPIVEKMIINVDTSKIALAGIKHDLETLKQIKSKIILASESHS